MLPSLDGEAPYKCPKCDYSVKQKYVLVLHFGISHKVVLDFIEEASKSNQSLGGQSMIIKTKLEANPTTPQLNTSWTGPRNSTTSKGQQQTSGSSRDPRAFDCPLCPLSISHSLRRNHLTKHFYAQLSAEIATKSASSTEAPFECHLCRHVAITRNGLIKHVGVVHQLVDQYIKDCHPLTTTTDATVSSSEAAAAAAAAVKTESESPSTSSTSATLPTNFECRLCDRPQFFR